MIVLRIGRNGGLDAASVGRTGGVAVRSRVAGGGGRVAGRSGRGGSVVGRSGGVGADRGELGAGRALVRAPDDPDGSLRALDDRERGRAGAMRRSSKKSPIRCTC